MTKRDPCTLSNYHEWLTKHTTVNLSINFQEQAVKGTISLDLESQTDRQSKEIVLDSSHVRVSDVKVNSASTTAWEVRDRVEPYGSPLHISVPQGAAKGEIVQVELGVETTSKCTALQFLTPAQTSNKKHPYVYSQCQAIHCRSIFPCQDTPDVKSTFTFNIRSALPVVASGLSVEAPEEKDGNADGKLYKFEQKVPIPTYLFGLASGDIVSAPIGPRSVVATGPEELKACQWELEGVEDFIQVAEKLIFPYQWGVYNVLVTPPSYPYGGMETPVFTFATPTLISGDRQNIDVIAHELSHAWSGNLVTNASWGHMWLNEGWTIYLERRIGMALHGEAERDFSAILGWKALEDSVDLFGHDHEYTKLIIDHEGIEPDDAFSTVPYEKGFHFVYYLERLVGREAFDKFIPHYFTKWSGKSLDSFEFKETFLDFFNNLGDESIKSKVAGIDWDAWFYKPGMPPKPHFDTSRVDVCYKLAEQWKNKDFEPSPKDVEDFTGNQKLVFLEALEKFEEPLTPEKSEVLGKVYGLASSKNAEIKSAYYKVALQVRDTSCYQGVAEHLGQVGRMKFVRPLFRALNKVDRDLALKTLEKNRDFYHPICKALVEKDLGVTGTN
ncbi:hypothetical protein ACRALDRAFT_1055092 [Sodiomyces alcalophilus JCM 7366]|uniref:uncharacterized protein n=1 Tax=Sodiomyces alcalophilus JCM 7366 TaxID=591952 RepID=UPI0039B3D123